MSFLRIQNTGGALSFDEDLGKEPLVFHGSCRLQFVLLLNGLQCFDGLKGYARLFFFLELMSTKGCDIQRYVSWTGQ